MDSEISDEKMLMLMGGGMDEKTRYMLAQKLLSEGADQLDKLGAIKGEHYGTITFFEWLQEFYIKPLTGERNAALDNLLRKAKNARMSIIDGQRGAERDRFFKLLEPNNWVMMGGGGKK